MVQSNWTLGDLKSGGWILLGVCLGRYCGRGMPLDLDSLIARFGADHVVINETKIKRRLRCTCGHVGGDLRMIPYDVTSGGKLYGR